jgi:transposase
MSRKDNQPSGWKEARRKRALELRELSWKQCDIAEALGMTEAAVSRWVAKVRAYGNEAWRAQPRPHGPLKLSEEQLQLITDLLAHGAEAYGFTGEVWTCARVTMVIRQVFGVSYHKAHVSRLLKQLDWTPQIPIERATQRDEKQIQQWREEVWPELKKRP